MFPVYDEQDAYTNYIALQLEVKILKRQKIYFSWKIGVELSHDTMSLLYISMT